MQHEVEAGLIGALLILLPAVLLVAYHGVDIAAKGVEGISADHLVMAHLLERQSLAVTGRMLRPPAFRHPGGEVVVAQFEAAVTAVTTVAERELGSVVPEARTDHITVIGVLVIVGHLGRETSVHRPAAHAAPHTRGSAEKAAVGVILCSDVGLHRAGGDG